VVLTIKELVLIPWFSTTKEPTWIPSVLSWNLANSLKVLKNPESKIYYSIMKIFNNSVLEVLGFQFYP
jgi:hypothetical protein